MLTRGLQHSPLTCIPTISRVFSVCRSHHTRMPSPPRVIPSRGHRIPIAFYLTKRQFYHLPSNLSHRLRPMWHGSSPLRPIRAYASSLSPEQSQQYLNKQQSQCHFKHRARRSRLTTSVCSEPQSWHHFPTTQGLFPSSWHREQV